MKTIKLPADGLTRRVKRKLIGTIVCVETQDKVAALTFDDGPHPEHTPRLLDLLEKHRARATFFMLGEAASMYPDLVRQVSEAGHAIGNHSWAHPSLPSLSGRERRRQVLACERAISPYGARLFRPPFGHQSLASRLDMVWLNYRVIMWSVMIGDWCEQDSDRMVSLLESKVKPGSIVLLHDAINSGGASTASLPLQFDRRHMLTALDKYLSRHGDGYSFVTVPELLHHGASVKRYWLVENDEGFPRLATRW
jgi:peptidoglycan/xylan/chitin deacetylase (PgdA/CDA1 family)